MTSPHITTHDAAAEHQAWIAERAAAVTAPLGNLALIETRWLQPGDTTSPAEAQASANAALVTPNPDLIVTELTRESLETGDPERGLRFWDASSPAIEAFERIETFDYDPAWRITGTFTPAEEGRVIPFEHLRDNGLSRDKFVPGDIAVTINGQDFTLAAFDDDGKLLLVFGDPTNGNIDPGLESYASGRFLFVTRERGEGTADGSDAVTGSVVLDFNRAFVPPCGFSDQYNCPLPPAQNRFPFEVIAGERKPVFQDSFSH